MNITFSWTQWSIKSTFSKIICVIAEFCGFVLSIVRRDGKIGCDSWNG